MYEYKTIKIEMDGNVAILTLNRPERHNCLNNTMAEEIADFYTKADEDPNIRCILLTGGTGKGFCGGADLVEWDEMNEKNDMVALDIWNKNDHKMILTMKNVKKPVIAAVNGSTAGAGCDMAGTADVRFVSKKAKFVYAYVEVGYPPDVGG